MQNDNTIDDSIIDVSANSEIPIDFGGIHAIQENQLPICNTDSWKIGQNTRKLSFITITGKTAKQFML